MWPTVGLGTLEKREILACTGNSTMISRTYSLVSCTNTKLYCLYDHHMGNTWHSWLRHWATSWKVAVLIPDGVIGIFH
jgi:hypothetical protein